jgi:hypothetical protein
MAAPIAKPQMGRGGAKRLMSGVLLGTLVVCGLVIEFKHGIEAITAPFADCVQFLDYFHTALQMNDATLFGMIGLVAMPVVTSITMIVAAVKMIGSAIARIAWRYRATPEISN